MNYRNQGEDRGEHGRGGYQRDQGRPRHDSEGIERAPWSEGSYSFGRPASYGEQDADGSGRGAGDWREDSRGMRGGWDDGRVSMEPRGDSRSSRENERSSYGSRGDSGYGSRGDSSFNSRSDSSQGSRGDSRSYPSAYGSQGTRGGFGADAGRQHESESQRGSRYSGSDSGNGGSWAAGRRWATENAGQAGSGLGFGGEGLGNQSWGPQSFNSNSGWASRAFEGMGGSYGGNDSQSDRGRHAGKGPKNYRRNDERIKEDVSERLKDQGDVDASDIEIEVSSGVVTLSGEVSSRREKRSAEDAVEGVSGVEDVTNQLRVRSRNEREDSERDAPNSRSSSSGTRQGSKSSPTGVGTLGQSMSAASHLDKSSPSKGRSIGSTNES